MNDTIEADRYPLSPRIRLLRSIGATLPMAPPDPPPARPRHPRNEARGEGVPACRWVLFETGCWRWRNPRRHRWDLPLKTRFAPDSPLEGTGFEPSVPRDTTNLSISPLLGSRQPKSRSEREPTHEASGPSPAEPMVRILFPPAARSAANWATLISSRSNRRGQGGGIDEIPEIKSTTGGPGRASASASIRVAMLTPSP